jgi:hypothetical protein
MVDQPQASNPFEIIHISRPGKGDGEIFEWVHANAKTPRAPWEIETWSGYMEKRGPESDGETLSFLPNTWGSTPRLAKTSRRGSAPWISTTTSASAGKPDPLTQNTSFLAKPPFSPP